MMINDLKLRMIIWKIWRCLCQLTTRREEHISRNEKDSVPRDEKNCHPQNDPEHDPFDSIWCTWFHLMWLGPTDFCRFDATWFHLMWLGRTGLYFIWHDLTGVCPFISLNSVLTNNVMMIAAVLFLKKWQTV